MLISTVWWMWWIIRRYIFCVIYYTRFIISVERSVRHPPYNHPFHNNRSQPPRSPQSIVVLWWFRNDHWWRITNHRRPRWVILYVYFCSGRLKNFIVGEASTKKTRNMNLEEETKRTTTTDSGNNLTYDSRRPYSRRSYQNLAPDIRSPRTESGYQNHHNYWFPTTTNSEDRPCASYLETCPAVPTCVRQYSWLGSVRRTVRRHSSRPDSLGDRRWHDHRSGYR